MLIKKIKPTKIGNSHYMLIPAQYIKDGQVNPEKTHDYDMQESEVTL